MDAEPTAIIALRGWHPALSRAEAEAMFSNSEIERTKARRLLIANGDSNWENALKMAGCECVLVGGGIAKWESLEKFLGLITPEKSKIWRLNAGGMKGKFQSQLVTLRGI